jgi:hypothetical protein
LINKRILAGRSPQTPELEARLAQTGLMNQLEAALGSAYGGVWLEPATAQLHVGVTTSQGRRAAEAAALDVGMAADVVATPVRSSWADLGAAQERWMQRLRALLEAGAFSSSLSARENAVVYDVGMIQVEPPNWAKAKNPVPVVPTIAPWSEGAESEPFPTIKETPPVETAESCYSGQRSGIRCGQIIKTGKIVESENELGERYEAKEIAEIKLTAKGGQGDSGSPAFSKTPYEKSEGFIEGIVTGGAAAESEFAYAQKFGFAEGLEGKTGVEYELLRQVNEKRHGKLKAGKYPVTIHGTGTSDKFSNEAGSVECKSNPFHAVASEESSTVTVTPEYKECKASFLGVSATIKMEGCTYVLHVNEKVSTDDYRAEMDISCPEGKSIKFTAGTCSWEVKAQTGRETVDLVDDTEASPKDITIRPTLTGIAYTVTQDGFLCPFGGTGEKTNGEYTSGGSTTLTGQSTTNLEEKIAIEITGE